MAVLKRMGSPQAPLEAQPSSLEDATQRARSMMGGRRAVLAASACLIALCLSPRETQGYMRSWQKVETVSSVAPDGRYLHTSVVVSCCREHLASASTARRLIHAAPRPFTSFDR